MKAVILAAGLGTRLRPITDSVPKCMVKVNGDCIIDKQIRNLHDAGVEDICVVSGYKAEILRNHIKNNFSGVTIIENARYYETNNMYSLYLTRNFICGDEFLLMNADVYMDGSIICGILDAPAGSYIASDQSQYLEESMKITVCDGIIDHISKKIVKADAYAVSIDVYRLSKDDGQKLFAEAIETIENLHDENSWTEVALDKIFSKASFRPYIIDGRWFEIDNHQDLATAETIFATEK